MMPDPRDFNVRKCPTKAQGGMDTASSPALDIFFFLEFPFWFLLFLFFFSVSHFCYPNREQLWPMAYI